jgi:hypothetical protein
MDVFKNGFVSVYRVSRSGTKRIKLYAVEGVLVPFVDSLALLKKCGF